MLRARKHAFESHLNSLSELRVERNNCFSEPGLAWHVGGRERAAMGGVVISVRHGQTRPARVRGFRFGCGGALV